MSESYYICRGSIGSWKYMSKGYGWTKHFSEAKAFASYAGATVQLNGRSGSIWTEAELKASPYYQSEMKTASNKSTAVEVIKPGKPAIVPTLKDGSDAKTAKHLTKLFTDAQTGMRRIVALGLFAWEVKEMKLKHGEFGAWLMANCPKLAVEDSVTGKPRPSRALSGYMDLTRSVLENVGFPTIEKYLATVAKCANDAHLGAGKFLLIADKKVPEDLKDVHDKICELVDGKTQRALFTEFKQAEEDAEGNTKAKRGRLKGQGGASKEQRAAAAELEAQERITEKKLKAQEVADWLIEMSDDAGFGEITNTAELDLLDRAMEQARGYIKHHGGKA